MIKLLSSKSVNKINDRITALEDRLATRERTGWSFTVDELVNRITQENIRQSSRNFTDSIGALSQRMNRIESFHGQLNGDLFALKEVLHALGAPLRAPESASRKKGR